MSAPWVIQDADLEDVLELAAYLALVLKPGDVVALNGELGAGKTTFARGVLNALLGRNEEEIPSPTFALVQTYEGRTAGGAACEVWHFDLYRLKEPEETVELGMDEAFAGAISLIEWPERMAGRLPANRLQIILGHLAGSRQDARSVRLVGHGRWRARLAPLAGELAQAVAP